MNGGQAGWFGGPDIERNRLQTNVHQPHECGECRRYDGHACEGHQHESGNQKRHRLQVIPRMEVGPAVCHIHHAPYNQGTGYHRVWAKTLDQRSEHADEAEQDCYRC